jgi:hypothetical protein
MGQESSKGEWSERDEYESREPSVASSKYSQTIHEAFSIGNAEGPAGSSSALRQGEGALHPGENEEAKSENHDLPSIHENDFWGAGSDHEYDAHSMSIRGHVPEKSKQVLRKTLALTLKGMHWQSDWKGEENQDSRIDIPEEDMHYGKSRYLQYATDEFFLLRHEDLANQYRVELNAQQSSGASQVRRAPTASPPPSPPCASAPSIHSDAARPPCPRPAEQRRRHAHGSPRPIGSAPRPVRRGSASPFGARASALSSLSIPPTSPRFTLLSAAARSGSPPHALRRRTPHPPAKPRPPPSGPATAAPALDRVRPSPRRP